MEIWEGQFLDNQLNGIGNYYSDYGGKKEAIYKTKEDTKDKKKSGHWKLGKKHGLFSVTIEGKEKDVIYNDDEEV